MSIVKQKKVSESAVHDQTYKIFPNDLNSNDTVFGGLVMSILDRVACVVAERHAERVCVTASVDSMHFLAAACKGDVLIFQASVNRSWRTSMEIGVRVTSEHHKLKGSKHILSAYLTFVALDKEGKPTEVPQVLAETLLEKRRYEEAELRRQSRKLEKEEKLRRRQEL